jgi:hypothetical protein
MKDEILKKKNYKKIELLEDKIKKKTIFNEKKIQKNKPSQLGSIY